MIHPMAAVPFIYLFNSFISLSLSLSSIFGCIHALFDELLSLSSPSLKVLFHFFFCSSPLASSSPPPSYLMVLSNALTKTFLFSSPTLLTPSPMRLTHSQGLFSLSLCAVFLVLHYDGYRAKADPEVPCYLIFGDSLIDNGNNNQLQSLARADYLPYGIDFGGPTRRFTNRKTTVDVIGTRNCIDLIRKEISGMREALELGFLGFTGLELSFADPSHLLLKNLLKHHDL